MATKDPLEKPSGRDPDPATTKAVSRGRTALRSDGAAARPACLAAAAVAGAAVGFAANYGRRMLVQGIGAAAGDWADMLKAEHPGDAGAVRQDRGDERRPDLGAIAPADEAQSALGKHAHQEENVIYPALREANSAHDADALNAEHGYIKTYLYELETLPNDSPDWLARVRDFRSMIQEHMRMEEDEVFPSSATR